MKILIVEDSKMVTLSIINMLSSTGFEIFNCENGKLALEFLEEGQEIDLILLDWNMPEMNGDIVLEHLSERKLTDAKIVMMTSENKPEKIMKALSTGACDYITKPFDESLLKAKIDQLFSH